MIHPASQSRLLDAVPSVSMWVIDKREEIAIAHLKTEYIVFDKRSKEVLA